MTTAEKRTQLEETGEPWPDCECHGEPFLWQPSKTGGRFYCRITQRDRVRNRRAARVAAGVCYDCAGELATQVLCRRCADRRQDFMSQPEQRLRHGFASTRYLQKRRVEEGFRPTGAGKAAFAAWLKGPG